MSTEFPPGPGGIGTLAHQLALRLVDNDVDVSILTPQHYASEEEIRSFNRAQPISINRLQAVPFSPLEGVYRYVRLSHYVKSRAPDVIVSSGSRAVWLTALYAQFHSTPWIAIGIGTEFTTSARWERVCTRWAFGQADAVVCVSRYTAERMHAIGIRPRWLQIVPGGADATTFRPLEADRIRAFRKRHGLEEATTILTVGNVTERKGQDVVIRALPNISMEVPDVQYLIVGLPTDRNTLCDLAARVGVADRVHFLGRVEQQTLVEAYNSCDLFVMTSRHTEDGDVEGYGIAVVEAALCGKTAVVSRGSGLEEAVVDAVTGLAVPQDDPSTTADAIKRLLQDCELRRRLESRARQRAERTQTWAVRAERYLDVVQRVITEQRRDVG